ncbi:MAG: crotonase [Chloroflexota bacterium]|nr:MAG: crotonase [Chloroflexota bacterium]
MELENISYSIDDHKGIGRIIINRPEVKNALNRDTRRELRAVIDALRHDYSIRVVVVTGAGNDAFVSGADVRDFQGVTPADIEEIASTMGQQLFNDIESLPMPVLAMINGYCFGAGCELAMACDVRIAAKNAKFGQLEINLGIMPGAGGTQRLPRLVGWGKAKEMLYTGKIIGAVEAERIGLVDSVVPVEKLEAEVNQLAEAIASKSPLVLRLLKKTINRGMYTDLAAGLSYEKGNFALCFATEDKAEGVEAFLGKRKPQFKGK